MLIMRHSKIPSAPLVCIYFIAIFLLPTALAHIPNCEFEDTVNITDSIRFDNGSYLHDGILIPAELTAEYNYEVLYLGEKESVPKHMRGCICKLKTCVKFCCHPTELKVNDLRVCEGVVEEELNLKPYVNITFNNGTERSVHVINEFYVQQGIPCHDAYKLVPEIYFQDEYKLYENGTLYRLFDEVLLTRRDYCLTPHKVDDIYVLTPMNCPDESVEPHNQLVNTIAMCVSIPFLVLTILVYICIPQLMNLHGKCLVCYLVSLSLGYTIMVVNNFYSKEFNDSVCSFVGFSAYYLFVAAFFWLSVISFDLWHNFRGTSCNVNRYEQNKRFLIYSLYAWGLAGVLTFLTVKAQFSEFDNSLKPGIGEEYCWLKTEDWSAMIYFFGPMLILIFFNMIMFILTSYKIYKVKKDLERIVARENDQRCLRSEKENFGLFLRLFIVMGITWMLEVMSYMVGSWSIWSILFYIPDICNASQGLIIFMLFVLKRKVKKLIKKRINLGDEASPFLANKNINSIRSTSKSHTSAISLTRINSTR